MSVSSAFTPYVNGNSLTLTDLHIGSGVSQMTLVNGNIFTTDGTSLSCGTTTGFTLSGAPAQKLGFFGKAPVVQQTATDLATVLVALKALGLLA